MGVVRRNPDLELGSAECDHMLVTYALPVLQTIFDASSLEDGKKFRALLKVKRMKIFTQSKDADLSLKSLAKGLEKLTMAEPAATLDILHSLIAVQLINVQDVNTKFWLDRLVQRFEVTKKLYETYLVGFRKGEGVSTSVRLYWLFALALCLFYARSNEIKYLNTLLKVCDLLCSLPEHELERHIIKHGLSVVLATEVLSVQLLCEKKGVSFASE